jgi:hypothetical protein
VQTLMGRWTGHGARTDGLTSGLPVAAAGTLSRGLRGSIGRCAPDQLGIGGTWGELTRNARARGCGIDLRARQFPVPRLSGYSPNSRPPPNSPRMPVVSTVIIADRRSSARRWMGIAGYRPDPTADNPCTGNSRPTWPRSSWRWSWDFSWRRMPGGACLAPTHGSGRALVDGTDVGHVLLAGRVRAGADGGRDSDQVVLGQGAVRGHRPGAPDVAHLLSSLHRTEPVAVARGDPSGVGDPAGDARAGLDQRPSSMGLEILELEG